MQEYFDIHSHILPGVDDGPKDMDETRNMLLIAYKEGIRIIAATPHYIAGGENITADKLLSTYEEVSQVAADISQEMQIVLGNELLYNSELLEALKKGEALTIDNTRYILLEFQTNDSFRKIWEGINHCIFGGYIPILAHAERYRCLLKDYDLVEDLIQSGTYIQLNLSSIIKKGVNRSKIFCRKLLKRGWVHFLGTDCHSTNKRKPEIYEAVNFLKKKYGDLVAQRLLWDNPMAMIEDRHLLE